MQILFIGKAIFRCKDTCFEFVPLKPSPQMYLNLGIYLPDLVYSLRFRRSEARILVVKYTEDRG